MLVGQFRSADGLVLLSGGKLGPQIFLPLVLFHISYSDPYKQFAFRKRIAPDLTAKPKSGATEAGRGPGPASQRESCNNSCM
jgi:hypothetical protein